MMHTTRPTHPIEPALCHLQSELLAGRVDLERAQALVPPLVRLYLAVLGLRSSWEQGNCHCTRSATVEPCRRCDIFLLVEAFDFDRLEVSLESKQLDAASHKSRCRAAAAHVLLARTWLNYRPVHPVGPSSVPPAPQEQEVREATDALVEAVLAHYGWGDLAVSPRGQQREAVAAAIVERLAELRCAA